MQVYHDSSRKTRLRSYAQLRSKDVIPVVCPTLVRRHDSDHMLDSGRRTRLWSYARLQLEDMTPIVYPDFRCTPRFWSTSQLQSRITAPINERATCLTTSAAKDFAWPG
jgi:hypothetical protein